MSLLSGRGDELGPAVAGSVAQFIGGSQRHAVSEALGTDQTAIRAVYFEPGARSRPHSHSCDQLLYFVQAGFVAVDGGPDQPIADGAFVLLPGGQLHMHGALDGAPAMHISIMREIDSDFTAPLPEAWARYGAS